MTTNEVISAVGGFFVGLVTVLLGVKKLLELVIDSYTGKLIEKFDERYTLQQLHAALEKRVTALEEGRVSHGPVR